MTRRSLPREPAADAARLSEGLVVDAALALIAERGLPGLSMRALGDALGVEAMSLYHWFPAKERLLDAIADRLIRQVALPPTPAAGRWRAWMTTVARGYRRMGLDHPRAFPLVGARRFLSPGAVDFLRAVIAANIAAGFEVRQSVRLTRSVGAFVNGIVLTEVSPPGELVPRRDAATPSRLSEPVWEEVLGYVRQPALDGAFDYGLQCLLDGALMRLSGRSSRRE